MPPRSSRPTPCASAPQTLTVSSTMPPCQQSQGGAPAQKNSPTVSTAPLLPQTSHGSWMTATSRTRPCSPPAPCPCGPAMHGSPRTSTPATTSCRRFETPTLASAPLLTHGPNPATRLPRQQQAPPSLSAAGMQIASQPPRLQRCSACMGSVCWIGRAREPATRTGTARLPKSGARATASAWIQSSRSKTILPRTPSNSSSTQKTAPPRMPPIIRPCSTTRTAHPRGKMSQTSWRCMACAPTRIGTSTWNSSIRRMHPEPMQASAAADRSSWAAFLPLPRQQFPGAQCFFLCLVPPSILSGGA